MGGQALERELVRRVDVACGDLKVDQRQRLDEDIGADGGGVHFFELFDDFEHRHALMERFQVEVHDPFVVIGDGAEGEERLNGGVFFGDVGKLGLNAHHLEGGCSGGSLGMHYDDAHVVGRQEVGGQDVEQAKGGCDAKRSGSECEFGPAQNITEPFFVGFEELVVEGVGEFFHEGFFGGCMVRLDKQAAEHGSERN